MNLTDLVGSVVDGKYSVERMLGRGGMGAVFFARHLGTDRPVALKIIIPQYAADASFLERFRREARAAGRFRHPNIVDVTDFGLADIGGQRAAYLVMEYLDGCSLEDVLQEQPVVPVDWTVEVFEQLALGVGELHEHGIIHRDLKPGNIWLEPNLRGGFRVKLLDFGLAKIHEPDPVPNEVSPPEVRQARSVDVTIAGGAGLPDSEAPTIVKTGNLGAPMSNPESEAVSLLGENRIPAAARPTADPVLSRETEPAGELTVAGSVLGTPAYMSPEQCRGTEVTMSSDVYSLGVIAYQMLGGALPFEGSMPALMAQHINVDPRELDDLNPDVPRAVARVVMSALKKDRQTGRRQPDSLPRR